MGDSVVLTILFVTFLAIGVGIFGFGLHSLNMSKKAEHWPTVQGEILTSEFDVSPGEGSDTYRAKVSYRYSVLGTSFTGKKIAFGYSNSSSESFHREIFNALKVKTQVAVRYNPEKPEQAVLSFGINQSIKFLLLFGAIWTVFTLGMMAMFWTSYQGTSTLLQNMIIYS